MSGRRAGQSNRIDFLIIFLLIVLVATIVGATLFLVQVSSTSNTLIVPAITSAAPSAIPVTATATLAPTNISTPEPTLTTTVTSTPDPDQVLENGDILHQMLFGETMPDVVNRYGVPEEKIRAANGMYGNTLLSGQIILIPRFSESPAVQFWFSTIWGNYVAGYPNTLNLERFTYHYPDQPILSRSPEAGARLVEDALFFIESMFTIRLEIMFDVYLAGSLFEPPDQALRGYSNSKSRMLFLLHDGSGSVYNQQYVITHEMTHMYMYNVYGDPPSNMVSEGAAVYVGMSSIRDSAQIPLESFCVAYLNAGKLPSPLYASYQGHIYDLENYYAAGCFIGYLAETRGIETIGRLYASNDYVQIFGMTYDELELEWRISLSQKETPQDFSPIRLVETQEKVEKAYNRFMVAISGTQSQLEAYLYLDQSRIALLEGRFDDAEDLLTTYWQIIDQ